ENINQKSGASIQNKFVSREYIESKRGVMHRPPRSTDVPPD
ncbi:unnamed protein product, partial [marine sediment metagenome]